MNNPVIKKEQNLFQVYPIIKRRQNINKEIKIIFMLNISFQPGNSKLISSEVLKQNQKKNY